MAQKRPDNDEITSAVDRGKRCVSLSKETRQRWRRRRAPTRQVRLEEARRKCADAAAPLRSYIGMCAWHEIPLELDLEMKKVMESLRYERRQIDKMLA